jgi:hypothetical protein
MPCAALALCRRCRRLYGILRCAAGGAGGADAQLVVTAERTADCERELARMRAAALQVGWHGRRPPRPFACSALFACATQCALCKYSRAGPGQCRAAVCEAARVYGFRPQDLEAELSAERAKFDAQKLAAQQALKQVGAKATPPIQA